MPQDVELFDGSVADNIARLGQSRLRGSGGGGEASQRARMILTLPQGYDTPVGEHGSRLSARAAPAHRARPRAVRQSAAGGARRAELQPRRAGRERRSPSPLAGCAATGVTSVVVTHRPSLIAHVDKILVLDCGRVQQFGPATEVMKSIQEAHPGGIVRGDQQRAKSSNEYLAPGTPTPPIASRSRRRRQTAKPCASDWCASGCWIIFGAIVPLGTVDGPRAAVDGGGGPGGSSRWTSIAGRCSTSKAASCAR